MVIRWRGTSVPLFNSILQNVLEKYKGNVEFEKLNDFKESLEIRYEIYKLISNISCSNNYRVISIIEKLKLKLKRNELTYVPSRWSWDLE